MTVPIHTSDDGRDARLGASEIAAVLGMSPFRTPFGVWAHRTGLEGDGGNAATVRGQYLEPGVLRWCADDRGAEELVEAGGYTGPWVCHPTDWPHVGCHPDGYLRTGEVWTGVEVKTARRADGWGDGDDEVPPHYWIQCQVGLALTGLPAWDLAVFHTISEKFARYELAPDVEVTREMLQRAEAWWAAHIIGGSPPDVDGSDDARRWLLSRYPTQRAPLREATAEQAMLALDVASMRAQIREIEAAEKLAAARLCAEIGEAEGFLLSGGGRVTWKAQTAERIDVKRLREERPEIAAAYLNETSTRVLRVTSPKETKR